MPTWKPWVSTTAKLTKRAVKFTAVGLAAGYVVFFFYDLNRVSRATYNEVKKPIVVEVTKVEPTATPSAKPTVRPTRPVFTPITPVISK